MKASLLILALVEGIFGASALAMGVLVLTSPPASVQAAVPLGVALSLVAGGSLLLAFAMWALFAGREREPRQEHDDQALPLPEEVLTPLGPPGEAVDVIARSLIRGGLVLRRAMRAHKSTLGREQEMRRTLEKEASELRVKIACIPKDLVQYYGTSSNGGKSRDVELLVASVRNAWAARRGVLATSVVQPLVDQAERIVQDSRAPHPIHHYSNVQVLQMLETVSDAWRKDDWFQKAMRWIEQRYGGKGAKAMFGKKKKVEPEELRARVGVAVTTMKNIERKCVDKESDARTRARQALKEGDERAFRVASKRAISARGVRNTAGSLVEFGEGLQDYLSLQASVREVAETSQDFLTYQRQIGLDQPQVREALKNLAVVSQKVEWTTTVLTEQLEQAVLAGDLSREQETMRKELLAEEEGDRVRTEDLEGRVKAAQTA